MCRKLRDRNLQRDCHFRTESRAEAPAPWPPLLLGRPFSRTHQTDGRYRLRRALGWQRSPRVKVAASLDDFAGSYRTPRGLALDMKAADDFLTLREPSGLTLRLEPIGPNLFEADYVAPGGWITRYSFDRDATCSVVSLSVLSRGAVNTFARNQSH